MAGKQGISTIKFVAPIFVCTILSFGGQAAVCPTYSLHDIASAIKQSNAADDTVRQRSCMWGGAARKESGGRLCAHNSNNFGILQLSRRNVESLGLSPKEYMAQSLQDQIDGWALAGASQNNASYGYERIDQDIGKSLKFGQTMEGALAACSQFGAVICNNDMKLIESGEAVPKKGGATAIRCTDSRCNNGTANQDGNGESIVSWGLAIQTEITDSECVEPGTGSQ